MSRVTLAQLRLQLRLSRAVATPMRVVGVGGVRVILRVAPPLARVLIGQATHVVQGEHFLSERAVVAFLVAVWPEQGTVLRLRTPLVQLLQACLIGSLIGSGYNR